MSNSMMILPSLALVACIIFLKVNYSDAAYNIKALRDFEYGVNTFARLRKSKDWVEEKDCGVHKVEQIHFVMDRVCEMCHEMFSHEMSSFRAQCRSNCFDNSFFRDCLKLFSETTKSAAPSERRIPDEPVMTIANFYKKR